MKALVKTPAKAKPGTKPKNGAAAEAALKMFA